MRIAPLIDRWFFLLPLLVYSATCARQIGLPDSAIIIDEMCQATVSSHVNCHSLNNLVGWLCQQLPGSQMVWKANFSSVLSGTLALALFHRLLLALRVPRLAAFLTATVLMVSHSVWWHATQADSYALSAALFCASLLLVVRDVEAAERGEETIWRLHILFFLAGLSLFNHLQNGALSLACAAHLLARTRRIAVMAQCAFAWLIGATPYVATLLHDLWVSEDPQTTLEWAVGGGFRTIMFDYQLLAAIKSFGHWLLLQFPSPVLALIPVGLFVVGRDARMRRMAVYPATMFAVTVAFFSGYATWDQFAFYLPCFLLLGLAAGLGAGWLMACNRIRATVVAALVLGVALPPFVYWNIPAWVSTGGGYWHSRYRDPWALYRDRYDLVGLYANPIGHDRGTVEAFLRSLAASLPPRAWLIDDVSIYYQFEYFQKTEGLRSDIRLLLLRPMGMAGWGRPAEEVVNLGTLAPGRLFIVATNGPCAPLIETFRSRGRMPVAFPLGDKCRIFELVPAPRDAQGALNE